MEYMIRNVADIIDMEYLQGIQDSIGRIMGITTALLDPGGVPISRPTNLNAFCAMMQASESGVQMCMKTNAKLIAENRSTRRPAILTCPNSGLRTAAVPIFLREEYLGSWLIGQIRMADIDPGLIRDTAQKAGLSTEDAKKNIDILPVISEPEFRNLVGFLETSTKTVTDLLEVNARLDSSLKTFQDFINITDIGAFLTDFNTDELLMSNKKYQEIARSWQIRKQIKSSLLDERREPNAGQIREIYNEDTGCWYSLKLRALRWIDSRLAVMTTIVDITEQKTAEQKMQYLAYYDQTLKIPNAVKLQNDLNQYCGDKLYMICFDTRNLREINNVYGRSAGDLLLFKIAEWAVGLTGPDVRLYRIKGNKFALLSRNLPETQVNQLAGQLFRRFDEVWPIDVDGIRQRIYSGTRIGVMQIREVPKSYEMLINLIERVLLAAGKAEEPVFYDDEKNEEFQQDSRLQVSLKACVLNNMEGFSLNYQPLVDTRDGRWVAMEALCRWNSPELGSVPPDIFIKKAEQMGYITTISQWVFEEAVSQVKKWKLDRAAHFHHISINLSPLQLRDRELLPKLTGVLEKYHYPAGKLFLEITETAEVPFDERTIALFQSMKQAGISLAIDDFGNGYASFLNLKRMPVDMLKTDRSFVDGIEKDTFLQKTMRIIVEYAHTIGLSVTVEGIETEQQWEIIEQNRANLIQGYYFSRPLTAAALAAEIHNFWN